LQIQGLQKKGKGKKRKTNTTLHLGNVPLLTHVPFWEQQAPYVIEQDEAVTPMKISIPFTHTRAI